MSPAQEFSVLVHELAHDAPPRPGRERPRSRPFATEAEAVAFVVGTSADWMWASSSDYIQLYDGDREMLAGRSLASNESGDPRRLEPASVGRAGIP
jgi:hypothetical protein